MVTGRPARISQDLQNGKSFLDEVNRRILTALTEEPRLSASELARRVGMSAPAVRERVNRLEQAGVIRGYRLDIDPAAIGLPVAAWVRIRPGPGQLPKIADLAARTPEVSECHRISGEDCFLLKVHEVVMEPGDYPEHTHEGPGLRIVHDGAIEITQQGKINRYKKGDYFFEGGHIPHTVKVPGPSAFRALYVEILPEE